MVNRVGSPVVPKPDLRMIRPPVMICAEDRTQFAVEVLNRLRQFLAAASRYQVAQILDLDAEGDDLRPLAFDVPLVGASLDLGRNLFLDDEFLRVLANRPEFDRERVQPGFDQFDVLAFETLGDPAVFAELDEKGFVAIERQIVPEPCHAANQLARADRDADPTMNLLGRPTEKFKFLGLARAPHGKALPHKFLLNVAHADAGKYKRHRFLVIVEFVLGVEEVFDALDARQAGADVGEVRVREGSHPRAEVEHATGTASGQRFGQAGVHAGVEHEVGSILNRRHSSSSSPSSCCSISSGSPSSGQMASPSGTL